MNCPSVLIVLSNNNAIRFKYADFKFTKTVRYMRAAITACANNSSDMFFGFTRVITSLICRNGFFFCGDWRGGEEGLKTNCDKFNIKKFYYFINENIVII